MIAGPGWGGVWQSGEGLSNGLGDCEGDWSLTGVQR
jgi:hypothetical protein